MVTKICFLPMIRLLSCSVLFIIIMMMMMMMISENDNDNDIDDDNDWWWRWWFRCSLSTQWFFVYLIPCQTEIWKCSFFEERGKPECPESNFLEQAQRERTHNKLNPHVALTLRFKHRPHLWEASASTIMPPLLPVVNLVCVCGTE